MTADPARQLHGFARVFDEALTVSGTSLVDLRSRLTARGHAVSAPTMSRWRSGTRQPEYARSAEVIATIEEELGLPAGALTSQIFGRSRRLGSVSPISSEQRDLVDQAFAALDVTPLEDLRLLSIVAEIDVDVQGNIASVSAAAMLQCVHHRVSSLGVVAIAPEPSSVRPEIVASAGGRTRADAVDIEGTVFGFAIDLDRPLAVGETAMLSLETRYPAGYPAQRRFASTASRPLRELILVLRFDPCAVPDWLEQVEHTSDRTRVRSVPITDGAVVHRLFSDFGPGRVELSWGWSD